MRITSGKVVSGRIELEEPLPEGSLVTILAPGDDEAFDLSEDDERDLLQSIAEADRGELIAASEVFRSLRSTE